MNTKNTARTAATSDKACPPCLPFCGLGADEALVERLKTCGQALLEQVQPARQEEYTTGLNHS